MKRLITVLLSTLLTVSLIVPVSAAQKNKKVHTVTYKYGAKTISTTVEDGGSVIPPSDTFVPGYIFTGWTDTSDNVKTDKVILGAYTKTTGEIKAPIKTLAYVDSIVTTYNTSATKFNNNTSAGWPVVWQTSNPILEEGEEGKTCAVHWYNGWTGQLWKTDIVEYGSSLAGPLPDPYMEGFSFVGWEGSWNNITEDRTISAHFVRVYKVVFVDSVTGAVFNTQNVLAGDTADKPNPPDHEGRVFTYYSGNCDNIQQDTTVYAVYDYDYDYNYYNYNRRLYY